MHAVDIRPLCAIKRRMSLRVQLKDGGIGRLRDPMNNKEDSMNKRSFLFSATVMVAMTLGLSVTPALAGGTDDLQLERVPKSMRSRLVDH